MAETGEGHVLWLMKRAFSLQRRTIEDAMRAHGVNATQAGVLTQLLEAPGLSSSDLARRLQVTAQAATVAVATLEDAGLVTRTDDALHGRIRRCHLTKQGHKVAEACIADAIDVEEKLLAVFDDEQRATYAALLSLFLREPPPGTLRWGAGQQQGLSSHSGT
jgi:DNA-binding MarR family transcriptional regulator